MPFSEIHIPRALACCVVALAGATLPNLAFGQCDTLIAAESVEVDYRGQPVRVCLELGYDVAAGADLSLDGVALAGTPPGCDFDTLVYYPYDILLDASPDGPYELTAWVVDGQTFTGAFGNLSELVALLNVIDNGGAWSLEAESRNVVGGAPGREYGQLTITPAPTGRAVVVNRNLERRAGGTAVDVDGAGYHEFVVDDPNAGCRDTLTIFLRPRFDEAERQVTTEFETTTGEFCAAAEGLPGTPTSYTVCEMPEDGTLVNTEGFCFVYEPSAGATGADELCIEVCDDTPAPYGPVCRRTRVEVIVRSVPVTSRDTARFSIANADTVVCLDDFVDVPRPYSSVEPCAPQPEGIRVVPGAANASPCVTLLPEPMYRGTAFACVAYCTGGACDTTVLAIDVAPRCNADVFAAATDTVVDDGDPTFYCIPVAADDLDDFELAVGGVPYEGDTRDCDVETRFSYDFGPVVTGGRAPYELVDWFVDGRGFGGRFDSLPELESLVRQVDPAGNWRLNMASLAIRGGDADASYGDMQITDAEGVNFLVTPDPFGVAVGVAIALPGAGSYEVTLVGRERCADRVTVIVGEAPPTPDTPSVPEFIEVVVDSGVVSDVFCLFDDRSGDFELLRPASSGFLTDAEEAGYCYTYTPNPGFVGADTVVAASCQPGGAPCDTMTALLTVRAPARPAEDLDPLRIPVRIIGDAPYEACATGLGLARPYTEARVVGSTGPYTAVSSPRNGCVIVDPGAPDAATGTVTVLFCESADPSRCQEVTFDIRQTATCSEGPFDLDSELLDPSDEPVEYCLADGADLANYEIRVDGVVAATTSPEGCGGSDSGEGELRDVYAYSVINVEDYDYRIEAWDVNGDALSRKETRGGFVGVADTMSAFDPDRDWFYNPELGLLHTTDLAGNYSSVLQLFDDRFSEVVTTTLSTESVRFGGDGGVPGAAPGSAVTLPGPGTYVIEAFNPAQDCGDRITVVIPPATLPSPDTIRIVVAEGRDNGPFCVPTDELPGTPMSVSLCGAPGNGTAALEPNSTCFTYRTDGYTGPDQLCVVACTDDPPLCDTTVYLIDVRAELPACVDVFTQGSFRAAVEDCDAPSEVCLPALPGDASDYTFAIAGEDREATVCGSAVVAFYDYAALPGAGLDGPYRVEAFAVGTETFTAEVADVAALVDSLRAWDPAGAWSLDFATERLTGGVAGANYGPLAVRQVGSDQLTTLTSATEAIDNRVSLSLMPGAYRVIVVDVRTGCPDTLTVEVECGCAQALPANFSRGVDCQASQVEVCLPISAVSLAAYTLTVDGAAYAGPTADCDEAAEFVIDELELYASPDGNPVSIAIDSFVIDGDLFIGRVSGVAELARQLDEWDFAAAWRYDPAAQLIRGGNPATDYSSLFVSAPELAGSAPREIILEPTVTSVGTLITIPAGAGERTLTLDDGDGCVQDVTLALVCVQTAEARDTVDVNGSLLFCVDDGEFTGAIDTLYDACPQAGDAVDFSFAAPIGCVAVTGVAPGESTACLVACDVNGVCDTTFYTVVVNASGGAIVAVDDTFRLRADETLRVPVTDNDDFAALTSLRITGEPGRGAADLSPEGVLTYTPAAGACGFTDSLRYELCSGTVCDAAAVYLRVRCEAVEAYTGFSPNGDGVNDAFVVEGIGEYPEATVRVYNRWGNLVFEALDGYDNGWEGTWDGNRLPAGTYFYLIEVPGEGEQAGYVQLWR